ncbi:hypothetical protein KW415_13240 [Vibrio fluvialis]|nr:hypothetical protein [Vibrio fluvialis]
MPHFLEIFTSTIDPQQSGQWIFLFCRPPLFLMRIFSSIQVILAELGRTICCIFVWLFACSLQLTHNNPDVVVKPEMGDVLFTITQP